MSKTTANLTEFDRHTINQARQLLGLQSADDVAAHTGETDIALGYSNAFGQAKYVMGELVALVERMAKAPQETFPVIPRGQVDAEVAADAHKMGWHDR